MKAYIVKHENLANLRELRKAVRDVRLANIQQGQLNGNEMRSQNHLTRYYMNTVEAYPFLHNIIFNALATKTDPPHAVVGVFFAGVYAALTAEGYKYEDVKGYLASGNTNTPSPNLFQAATETPKDTDNSDHHSLGQ
ncbi:MAG: hypothetical protein COB66_02260 [Coxiella sp. (in: Bacteria)]|nr:MAG: hypothetical protein COB66_02260 [Coxiella sp. (in: g-proteobacteria)]